MKKANDNQKDEKILIPKFFPPELSADGEQDEKVNSRGTRARCVFMTLT